MADHFNHLSLGKRQLVQLMQEVGYGRIESFAIRCGEPLFDERPRVVLELRVPMAAGARRQPPAAGVAVKAAVTELLDLFTRVGDARVEWLEVRDGLPVRVALIGQNGVEGVAGLRGGEDRPSRSAIGGQGK